MPQDLDLTRPNGRRIRARSLGRAEAPCLVYLHGTPDSRLSIDILGELPCHRDVRLIAFDRPGYGGSDFAPFSFASVAEDLTAVMNAYEVERLAVLGQSGGGPFALACGALLPDRVTGIGVAAGPGPAVSVPGGRSDLVDTDLQALDQISLNDSEAARLFSLGFGELADISRAGNDAMASALRAMLVADASVLDRLGIAGGLAASIAEGLRQGLLGCAWDNVAWVGAWQFDLSAITQPTWLWYGELDPMVPPANGRWLKQQLPHADLVVRPAEGHAAIFAHWDEMVSSLLTTLG